MQTENVTSITMHKLMKWLDILPFVYMGKIPPNSFPPQLTHCEGGEPEWRSVSLGGSQKPPLFGSGYVSLNWCVYHSFPKSFCIISFRLSMHQLLNLKLLRTVPRALWPAIQARGNCQVLLEDTEGICRSDVVVLGHIGLVELARI